MTCFLSPKYTHLRRQTRLRCGNEAKLSWLEQQLAAGAASGPEGLGDGTHSARYRSLFNGFKIQECLRRASAGHSFYRQTRWPICWSNMPTWCGSGSSRTRTWMRCGCWSLRAKERQSADEHRVAIKMVPSISPVDGNNPSFTIARVNPSSAMLAELRGDCSFKPDRHRH